MQASKHERHVFAWLANVQHQASHYGSVRDLRLRAQVVRGCVWLEVTTRSLSLAKAPPTWFMLACTGEMSERAPRRPKQGVTWSRYSCSLDADVFEYVLARYVRREPARRQQAARGVR